MRRRDFLQSGFYAATAAASPRSAVPRRISNAPHTPGYPDLRTTRNDEDRIRSAFHFALGDLFSNIRDYKGGLLKWEQPVLCAGADYKDPWTRDTAINTWNGFGLLFPNVAKPTLLSCLDRAEHSPVITGQYWDKIIWALGAWNFYLYSGDRDFLAVAFETSRRTLRQLEADEFDSGLGLFRGPAVYGDGIGAYPPIYTKTGAYTGGEWVSTITKWVSENPELRAPHGFGLPMHALSTNCLYRAAYMTLAEMARELKVAGVPSWLQKADKLRSAINREFWMEHHGTYRYLVDPNGNCDRQEGMGLAFALLFDVANSAQRAAVYRNTYISPAGIPCLYPSFERYVNAEHTSYGRHSGTVWPHIEAFWGHAAARDGQLQIFANELEKLTAHAWRDKQFVEIYHPDTGLPYGGIQESNSDPFWQPWPVCNRQSWSASGYLRLILMGMFGASFYPDGIRFQPCMPLNSGWAELKGLRYRNATLNVEITGRGTRVSEFRVNGVTRSHPFLPVSAQGVHHVEIAITGEEHENTV
jgi:mannosylglycerate hydrolase MGH1-like protein